MSVSQLVSLSHESSWTLYTSRYSPPIFTKLAIKIQSREMWLPMVSAGNPKYAFRQTGKGIIFHRCSYGKIALMSDISKTATDTSMGSTEVEYETNSALSIGIMTFDVGWPWTVLVQDNLNYTSNISKRWQIRCWAKRSWIESHPCAVDWHHHLWPWMTLNRPR